MDYVISASYGNDSMALMQWAHETSLLYFGSVTVAFCDTGWASPRWAARVDEGEEVARRYGFEPVRLKSMGMEELVRMKQGWPGNGQQFCTAHLKGIPFLQWIDEIDTERKSIVMVGKRRVESEARKDTPEWVYDSEYHGGRTLWHPLYLHTDEDRDALLNRGGIEILPHRSEECNPCVNANKGDIRRLTAFELQRVNRLEVEIGKPMFRPKRFNAIGIYGVRMWAKHGKNHDADVDPSVGDCSENFGCGL